MSLDHPTLEIYWIYEIRIRYIEVFQILLVPLKCLWYFKANITQASYLIWLLVTTEELSKIIIGDVLPLVETFISRNSCWDKLCLSVYPIADNELNSFGFLWSWGKDGSCLRLCCWIGLLFVRYTELSQLNIT